MQVQPYLFFTENCEEALEFYKKALGAEVQVMMRYKESPEPPPADKVPANWGDKIMHANVRIGETQVMASDGCPQEGAGFKNFSLPFWQPMKRKPTGYSTPSPMAARCRCRLAKRFFRRASAW